MKVQDFDFTLPPELIAQTPLDKRDESRLMVVAKSEETITDDHFYNLPRYLKPGDVLVRNNTKVLPARLFGVKEDTGGHVEILLLKDLGNDIWECLVGNAKIVKENTVITIGPLKARCVKVLDEGIRHFQMIYEGIFYELLDELGTMPLPPYIKETLQDNDRYNTVYATVAGSAAAPTAGLHFTPELFNEIKSMGVTVLDVTLHVGLGTFRPVKQENVQDHHMHSEYYEMNEETAQALNQAKAEKRRIIAVGTTSTRVLETIYGKYSRFQAGKGNTDIFIYPGYEFKAIDALITNFHLPKSTLVMLVCALAGKDLIFKAYDHAIAERYRFFSFGDSMLILP